MKSRFAVAVAAVFTGITTITVQGTMVHSDKLPTGVTADAKLSGNFIYLEAETATQGANDTFSYAGDSSHTFYRTGANPSDYWGSPTNVDPRVAARGADTGNFSNIKIYWENLDVTLASGLYDVYVNAYTSSGGTQTFTLSAADSLANLTTGSTTNSVTTTATNELAWIKLGTVAINSDTDTFGLTVSSSHSTIRFDTVLLVAVPEIASLSMLSFGALTLLAKRRR